MKSKCLSMKINLRIKFKKGTGKFIFANFWVEKLCWRKPGKLTLSRGKEVTVGLSIGSIRGPYTSVEKKVGNEIV